MRRLAVIDLPYSDEDDIVPLLLPRLADTDAQVRAEAVRALEGFEEPEVVQALAALLLDADADVRKAAGDVLAELKETALGRAAAADAARAAAAEVRALAFHAVRALRSPQAFEPAMQSLRDPDAAVRREAVGVLGYLKDPAAIGELAEVAANDPDVEVRRIAVGALGYVERRQRAAGPDPRARRQRLDGARGSGADHRQAAACRWPSPSWCMRCRTTTGRCA